MAGVTISLPALPKDESARIRKREPQHNVPSGWKPQENKGIPEWGMFQVYVMPGAHRPYWTVSLGTGAGTLECLGRIGRAARSLQLCCVPGFQRPQGFLQIRTQRHFFCRLSRGEQPGLFRREPAEDIT